jgi:hypothetical protein
MYENAAAAALAAAQDASAAAAAPAPGVAAVGSAPGAPAGAGTGVAGVGDPGTRGSESLIPCDAALRQFMRDVRQGTLFKSMELQGRMPTVGALWFHHLRALGVLERWAKWDERHVQELPITERGLVILPDGSVGCRHDTVELEKLVKQTVNYLMKGCGCTKGCKAQSCACLKNKLPCGPMCHRKALKAGAVFCACENVASARAAPAEQQAAGGGVTAVVETGDVVEDAGLAVDAAGGGGGGEGDRETDEGNFVCGECTEESCDDQCMQCCRTIVPPGVRAEQEAGDASDDGEDEEEESRDADDADDSSQDEDPLDQRGDWDR